MSIASCPPRPFLILAIDLQGLVGPAFHLHELSLPPLLRLTPSVHAASVPELAVLSPRALTAPISLSLSPSPSHFAPSDFLDGGGSRSAVGIAPSRRAPVSSTGYVLRFLSYGIQLNQPLLHNLQATELGFTVRNCKSCFNLTCKISVFSVIFPPASILCKICST